MSAEAHFLRLVAHWPSLGSDDATAQVRARDWLAALRIMGDDNAGRAVEHLVQHSARPPRIADLKSAASAQDRLQGQHFARIELPASERPAFDAERHAQIQANLTAKRQQRSLERAKRSVEAWSPLHGGDATEPMLTYDEVYGTPEPPAD